VRLTFCRNRALPRTLTVRITSGSLGHRIRDRLEVAGEVGLETKASEPAIAEDVKTVGRADEQCIVVADHREDDIRNVVSRDAAAGKVVTNETTTAICAFRIIHQPCPDGIGFDQHRGYGPVREFWNRKKRELLAAHIEIAEITHTRGPLAVIKCFSKPDPLADNLVTASRAHQAFYSNSGTASACYGRPLIFAIGAEKFVHAERDFGECERRNGVARLKG